MSALDGTFAAIGRGARDWFSMLGALSLVTARTVAALPRLNRRELRRELVHFGYGSLGLAVGVATLTGATVVLQTRLYVERFGARGFMGWAAGYAVLWELGPLLLGLLLAARVGARNAAELATLSVGGQIEGLRGVSLDPFGLLVAPRVVALILSSLALSSVAFSVAIAWEATAAYFALKLPLKAFWANFSDMLAPRDLASGVLKVLVFGVAISLISTTAGLRASGGARAVGQAAAAAVVSSCAAIFALDFLLTPLLSRWLA